MHCPTVSSYLVDAAAVGDLLHHPGVLLPTSLLCLTLANIPPWCCTLVCVSLQGSLNEPAAKEALLAACATPYAITSGDYMASLARVHCKRRGWM
jgi:hypothetical protein